MKHISLITAIAALMCLVSCVDKETGRRRSIAMAEEIMSDTTSYYNRQLRVGREINVHGTIAVVGAPKDAMIVSEYLLGYDRHDNISGRMASDLLPDFAGETLAQVMDEASVSAYGTYNENDLRLREANVRNFLGAIDTVALQSPYDTAHSVWKQRSKIVILASAASEELGFFDVDTLCKSTGSAVMPVSPLGAMKRLVKARHSENMNLVIWADSQKSEAGLYGKARAYCPQKDSSSTVRGMFLEVLDRYLATGSTERLSAVLVDDLYISESELEMVVKELLSTDEDNLLIYKNILDGDFECITPGRAIAEQCYAFLRENNAFTHRIAYPDLDFYITSGSGTMVQLRDRYFSEELMEFMDEYAPKSYSIYVR